jgi:hypothetical protein
LPNLYRAAGFAPPTSRRKAAEHIEKIKQTVDERHALYGARTPQRRLKSRNSFLETVEVEPPEDFPLTQICPGSHLLDFNTWKSLNRIITGVAPLKTNMVKWGKTNSDDLYCGCGDVQDMGHLLSCRDCPQKCTLEDVWLANEKGFDVAQYWAKNL